MAGHNVIAPEGLSFAVLRDPGANPGVGDFGRTRLGIESQFPPFGPLVGCGTRPIG
jgi:hypothetical protein